MGQTINITVHNHYIKKKKSLFHIYFSKIFILFKINRFKIDEHEMKYLRSAARIVNGTRKEKFALAIDD